MNANTALNSTVPSSQRREVASNNQHIWDEQLERLQAVIAFHAKYDDVETPKLPELIISGARKLLLKLEADGVAPPLIIVGSPDATIVFEWHNWEEQKKFRSLEVVSENEAEDFINDPSRKSYSLTMVTF